MLKNDWERSQRKRDFKGNSCQKFEMHYFTFKIFINVPFTNAHMMAVIEDSDSLLLWSGYISWMFWNFDLCPKNIFPFSHRKVYWATVNTLGMQRRAWYVILDTDWVSFSVHLLSNTDFYHTVTQEGATESHTVLSIHSSFEVLPAQVFFLHVRAKKLLVPNVRMILLVSFICSP